MTVTAAAARHRTLWLLTLHGVIRPPDPAAGEVWQLELDRLVREGRARMAPTAEVVEALPHPRAPKWTAEAEAAIVQATRLILSTLGATGAPIRACRALAAEWGLSPEAAAEARQRLIADGLVRVTDTNATAAVMTPPPPLSVTPESLGLLRRQRPRPKPAPSQMAPPASAPTAPVPPAAPTPAAKPEPLEPVVQPAPAEPVRRQPDLSRSPVRAERSTPKPKPAPAADDAGALLRRLVHAAEVSAGLVEAPTRIRKPLRQSPLFDTILRLCVVLAGAGRPMMASEISRGHLTPAQQRFLHPALADGVRRGGFVATGGRGGRGTRYSLADPTVFDGVTWESLNAAVEAQRLARERRKVG